MSAPILYYITDRTAFAADEPSRRRRLLEKIAQAARAGVDYIQLREKDLPTRDLESLAGEAILAIREARLATGHQPLTTALLINSRTDIALATGADGVHLRSDDVSPQEVKTMWTCDGGRLTRAGSPGTPLIGVSCHSPSEVAQAAANGATFVAFGPVFDKKDAPGAQPTGLAQVRAACHAGIPVLALGGVTISNAKSCLEAGAAGVAAIRLFQEGNVEEVVRSWRS